jgi:hypothetical protein
MELMWVRSKRAFFQQDVQLPCRAAPNDNHRQTKDGLTVFMVVFMIDEHVDCPY